jgi:hypothetical protein
MMTMDTHEECMHCGESVRIDRRHWRVHITTDNVEVPQDYDGEDSQGTFALGSVCRKNYAHAYREDKFE